MYHRVVFKRCVNGLNGRLGKQWIYDNHYGPGKDSHPPQMMDVRSPRYDHRGAASASRPLGSPRSEELASAAARPLKSEDLAHSATPDPDPASLRQRLIGTRRRAEQGWARLISQNHCIKVHTLRGAVLCSHPDIPQWHR